MDKKKHLKKLRLILKINKSKLANNKHALNTSCRKIITITEVYKTLNINRQKNINNTSKKESYFVKYLIIK